jgi:hypothetical protein
LRDLTLIVTDLYFSPEALGPSDAPGAPEPESASAPQELPALEQILARSRSVTPGDWRSWIAALCHLEAPVERPALPVAAISRQAIAADSHDQWWLGTAVHLQSVHDHVRLTQVLALSGDEWAMLARGYLQALGADGLHWEQGSGSSAFLRAAAPLEAETQDPARSMGRDVHDALPRGRDAPRLKRLMTELQMWLYDHPINRTRERGGLPVVNGLWLWGGGALPPAPRPGGLPRLFSDDLFLRGLWRMAGTSSQPLPSSTGAGIIATASEQPSVAIGLALHQLPGENDGERMKALDREWLEPALLALRRGALREFRLHMNDRLFIVRRNDLLRFWRRPRPWKEVLS